MRFSHLCLLTAIVAATAACAEERKPGERRGSAGADVVAPAQPDVEAQVAQVKSKMSTVAALGRKAKAELDKVYRPTHRYSLAISTVSDSPAHRAKRDALPQVTVGSVSVSYEQATSVSLGGDSGSRFFRAIWLRGDQVVIVGFETREPIDTTGFAQVLPMLVPAVEQVLP
jgi:hypothetical protein